MKRMIAILLLLTLSLSMWGCSSKAINTNPTTTHNRPNSSISIQRPNNNNNSDNNTTSPSTKIDPNGFSTMEQCIDAYLAYVYGKASKDQLYRMKPVQFWEEEYSDANFDDFYSEYVSNFAENRKKAEARYGTDFQVTYEIMSHEVVKDFSKESIGADGEQECIDTYGVSSKEVCQYSILISITVKGSKAEESGQQEINCLKAGTKWYL